MEEIIKKVARLKGLIEGMELDASSNEAKLFNSIADILEDITDEVSFMQDDYAEMADYVDELDCDLGDVEEYLYGDEDGFDDDEFDVDEDFVQAECPDCGEKFCFEADCDPEDVICPNCGGHFTCVCQCDETDADCNSCVKIKNEDGE